MADVHFCSACGHAVPSGALSCPSCKHLVHAARVDQLVQQARGYQSAGQLGPARAAWAEALTLLPPESAPAAMARERVVTLSQVVHPPTAPVTASASAPQDKPQPAWIKRLGPFAGVGVAVWKFSGLLLLAFSKLKFLLFGLGKVKTLLTMLASMGLYWSWYGWPFALGFILGIYVHEMGHVWALRRFGLRASVPMFIPGFGALVSLYDSPRDVGEDARIGLAGPMWGAGAAIACLLPTLLPSPPGGAGIWMAVARATALINLFNLTPVWQLDGGRGFRALDYFQRLYLAVLMLAVWWFTGEGLVLILILGAAYRIFWTKDHASQGGDQPVFLQFAGLVVLFGALMALIPIRQ